MATLAPLTIGSEVAHIEDIGLQFDGKVIAVEDVPVENGVVSFYTVRWSDGAEDTYKRSDLLAREDSEGSESAETIEQAAPTTAAIRAKSAFFIAYACVLATKPKDAIGSSPRRYPLVHEELFLDRSDACEWAYFQNAEERAPDAIKWKVVDVVVPALLDYVGDTPFVPAEAEEPYTDASGIAMRCPAIGCNAPLSQTSSGHECNSVTCKRGHTFGLWQDSLVEVDQAEACAQ